jgi:leucyl/phenylalanyl-tRNA---protein transferase
VPTESPPTPWRFPDPTEATDDLVGVGADMDPGTVLSAYRSGIFPMPVRRRVMGWWSPDPRGVLPLDGLRVSRSLRRSCAWFEVRFDERFDDVIEACASPQRDHGWIDRRVVAAYARLFELGWVHTAEAYDIDTGDLVGGLYGVAIGALFAGESMFHHARDASKVALVALVERLRRDGFELLDVQWHTDHLASLGVVEIPRAEYLDQLRHAVATPHRWGSGAVTDR